MLNIMLAHLEHFTQSMFLSK